MVTSNMLLFIGQLFIKRFCVALILAVTIFSGITFAQSLEPYKAGVVRIYNTKLNDVGTGFIVKIDKDRVYIITAAHVVKRDAHPNVYLFNRPNDPVQSTLINREDDDQKGLALLEVKANKEAMKGLVSLKFGKSSVKGGETVSVIGFPDGTKLWSVTQGTISRLEGRNLIFSGPIRGGNSGGPVLLGGQVIGVVTDTIQDLDYAVRVENVVNYIEGLPNLANLLEEPKKELVTIALSPENAKFCQALEQITNASRNDFSAIINVKSSNAVGELFESSVNLPGTYTGSIYTESKYFQAISKNNDKYGSDYYKFISMIKLCLPNWKQTDSSKNERRNSSALEVIRSSDPKYYRFTESDKGVVVEVSQHLMDFDHSYYTDVTVYAPDSKRKGRYSLIKERSALSALDIISDENKSDEICQAILKFLDASHNDFYSIVKPSSAPGIFGSTIEMPGFPDAYVRPGDSVRLIIFADNKSEVESLYYRLIVIVRNCLTGWKQKERRNDLSALSDDDKVYQFFENKPGSVIEIRYWNYKSTNSNLAITIYSPNSPSLPK